MIALGGEYYRLVESQEFSDDEVDSEASNELKGAKGELGATTPTDKQALAKVSFLGSNTPTGPIGPTGDESNTVYSLGTLVRFVASFNKPELKLILLGVVFVVLAGCAQPTQAVLYAKAIAAITTSANRDQLQRDTDFWALMLLALGLAQLLFYAVQGTCLGVGSEKLTSRARGTAFRVMLRQEIAFFDREDNTTGSLTSFLSAETRHLSGISGIILGSILMTVTTLTASLVVALAVGWKLALVCISVVPFLLACGFWRVSILARFQVHSKRAYEASATYACEATTAIRTVAALTKEEEILAQYDRQLGRQARDSLAWTLKASALYALSQAVTFFCQALAFWYGGTLLASREYSIFQFFVCFSEIMYSTNAAGSIFHHASDMGKAKNAAADFKRLFDRRPDIDVWSEEGEKVSSAAVEGMVEFRDVHFRYPTRPEHAVLSGLSFKVEPGQYVALVGPSGCGKSTTIALLDRFYNVTSGGVYLDGRDVSQLNVNSYRNLLALVSQEPTLYQGTVRENILLGSQDRDVSEEALVAACKEANIHDFIQSLPYVDPHLHIGNKNQPTNKRKSVMQRRLRYAGGQSREHAVGRAKAARGDCAGADPQPARPAARRVDLGLGFRVGEGRAGGSGRRRQGPHHHRRRAPPVHRAKGPCDLCVGPGPRGGERDAPGADAQQGALLRAGQLAAAWIEQILFISKIL